MEIRFCGHPLCSEFIPSWILAEWPFADNNFQAQFILVKGQITKPAAPKTSLHKKIMKAFFKPSFYPISGISAPSEIIWNAKQKHTQRHLPQQCLTTKPLPLARANSVLSRKHLQAPFIFCFPSLSPSRKLLLFILFWHFTRLLWRSSQHAAPLPFRLGHIWKRTESM